MFLFDSTSSGLCAFALDPDELRKTEDELATGECASRWLCNIGVGCAAGECRDVDVEEDACEAGPDQCRIRDLFRLESAS